MHFAIYLDIEALLDTRLGRLKMLDPDIQFKIAEKFAEYQGRPHDDFDLLFPTIDMEEYRKIPLSLDVIKGSVRTNVIGPIENAIRAAVNSEHQVDSVSITVNMRNIHLSGSALTTFRQNMERMFDHRYRISFVNKPTIRAKWMRRAFNLAFVYNLDELVKTITEDLAPLDKPVVYSPFILKDGRKMREMMRMHQASGFGDEPIKFMEESLGNLLTVSFIDMKNFSCFIPN